MTTTRGILCGHCHGRHATVDDVRRCHSPSKETADPTNSGNPVPTADSHRKRGEPVFGDELVETTFTWDYWCDLCGKELADRAAIYRPATNGRGAGGWCKECARAYDFLDLTPSVATSRDPDSIGALYHFTDARNLESIREHGILNLDLLETRGVTAHMSSSPTSRNIDRRDGLSGFVRLALHPHHPMAWKALYDNRTDEIAWLRINASILQSPSTKYSDTNALSAGRTIGANHLLATRGTDQAEAMVPHVPTSEIVDIVNTISV